MCVTSVVPPDRNFYEQRSAARAAANCLTFHWNPASSHASHTIARFQIICWAEARIKVARMTLTIELDGNWNSFQLANSAPQLSITDSAIAPFREDAFKDPLANTSLAKIFLRPLSTLRKDDCQDILQAHWRKASRGFEPRSLDSESRVLPVTPRGQVSSLVLLAVCPFSASTSSPTS